MRIGLESGPILLSLVGGFVGVLLFWLCHRLEHRSVDLAQEPSVSSDAHLLKALEAFEEEEDNRRGRRVRELDEKDDSLDMCGDVRTTRSGGVGGRTGADQDGDSSQGQLELEQTLKECQDRTRTAVAQLDACTKKPEARHEELLENLAAINDELSRGSDPSERSMRSTVVCNVLLETDGLRTISELQRSKWQDVATDSKRLFQLLIPMIWHK